MTELHLRIQLAGSNLVQRSTCTSTMPHNRNSTGPFSHRQLGSSLWYWRKGSNTPCITRPVVDIERMRPGH